MYKEGRAQEAESELKSIWNTTEWKEDDFAVKRQVVQHLTTMTRGKEHYKWFRILNEIQRSIGQEDQTTCPICFEELTPHDSENPSSIYITPCHHAMHMRCWERHQAAQVDGITSCPVCRHEIIVRTAPAVCFNNMTIPLRPGQNLQSHFQV